ncbi:hypothetical protein HPB47_023671 [Ixodes persulcatus]|uniref:Uncharacterized protein n=1 Tax=Ixodes persulcatus TaxID=34615 RepID=A0AC60Q7H2_IXOPE|nr:hypothetical protein HPB47_023671 [Ixodes persulcatus]
MSDGGNQIRGLPPSFIDGDGKPLPQEPRQTQLKPGKLTIHEARKEDQGPYRCIAVGRHGEMATRDLHVIVVEEHIDDINPANISAFLTTATKSATDFRQVDMNTPTPDTHLLSLWDRRTAALTKYRRHKWRCYLKRVTLLTKEASTYAQTLSLTRWIAHCESFDRTTKLGEDPAQVIAYTDAALHTSGWSATAAVFPSHDPAECDPIVVANTNMTLSSPEQAEARAVLLALQTYEVRNPEPGTLMVFTDSQNTIRALKTHLLTSSPTIAAIYDTALRLYRHRRVRVSIRWVPGHAGIDGHEKAHKVAFEELHRDFPSSQRTLPVPPMSPNDDQFPEDEVYVYDPVDAVRLVRRD